MMRKINKSVICAAMAGVLCVSVLGACKKEFTLGDYEYKKTSAELMTFES